MSRIQSSHTHVPLPGASTRRLQLAAAALAGLAVTVAVAAGGMIIGGDPGEGAAGGRLGLPESIAPEYIVPEHSIVVR